MLISASDVGLEDFDDEENVEDRGSYQARSSTSCDARISSSLGGSQSAMYYSPGDNETAVSLTG